MCRVDSENFKPGWLVQNCVEQESHFAPLRVDHLPRWPALGPAHCPGRLPRASMWTIGAPAL